MAFTYASNDPWPYWTTTATASTSTTVWLQWVSDSTTTNITANTVWGYWNSGASYVHAVEPLSEEQRAEQARQAEVRREEAAAAKDRARALLESVLTKKQRSELAKDGHFHVHTRKGLRTYRLKPGSLPVLVKGEDGSRYSYCIHPDGSYPAEDTVAALKLMLETDEERFLQTANATRVAA